MEPQSMENLMQPQLQNLQYKKSLKESLHHLEDIVLTEEELDEAIVNAKLLKKKKAEQEEVNKKIEENRKQLSTAKFTYDQMYGLMLYRAGQLLSTGVLKEKFKIDEYNQHVIFLLTCYFTKDKRFNEAGYDLNKGICLAGNPGRGKSTIMRLFQKNTRQCYYIKGCKDVAGSYQKNGQQIIESFSSPIIAAYNDKDVFYQKEIGVCFSDLGTEAIKKSYGNESNVMEDIIFERDRVALRRDLTHIETNLDADEIEQFYGIRIRSRIREMFNWIELPGPDRRK